MNILENKRVAALSAVFALAFAGLAYYGYSRSCDFSAAKEKLNEIDTRFQDYEAAEFPPTAANRDAMKKAGETVARQVGDLKAILQGYRDACNASGTVISPTEFQRQVNVAIDEMSRKAAEQGCNIASSATDLGFSSYRNTAAREANIPYLHFLLRATRRLADIVIDSDSPSLEKVYCAPLPEDIIESRKKPDYFPLNIEIAFNAKRSEATDGQTPDTMSVLPQVLNKLAADKEFFFRVTGVAVASTDPNLPPVDTYVAPEAPATTGDDLAEDEEGAKKAAAETGRVIAVRKTGDPAETVRVHLTIQALYFNPNSPSKGK